MNAILDNCIMLEELSVKRLHGIIDDLKFGDAEILQEQSTPHRLFKDNARNHVDDLHVMFLDLQIAKKEDNPTSPLVAYKPKPNDQNMQVGDKVML
ncbi:hypothetical protein Fmac_011479 [Flemingia macrophylla]|uniref:Uncharacterized protein n=1 Tax=Flemingia macrophylla TaxID=520843 RepID=A0ABD1MMJ4_9FABA